ncbi:MAG TPA: hypothetical protein VHT25_13470 [Solirubrobacteraceae bacterium]|jgi:hypothetical protein|nr:hypothetical protein [Solirubrobacteraceae bacterium]
MPTTEQTQPRTGGIVEVLWSTAIAALLVFVLAQAVGALGARAGGALAGLPVIATVLAVNAHRRRGAAAPTTLLRGMLEGMAGFVVFCEVVAAFAIRGGTLLTFLLAALAALTVQAAVVYLRCPLPDFVGWLTAARDQVRGASKMSRGFESGRQRLER